MEFALGFELSKGMIELSVLTERLVQRVAISGSIKGLILAIGKGFESLLCFLLAVA